MDPNATLTTIREAVSGMSSTDDSVEYDEWAAILLEHVAALDEWLTRGGFLPQEWVTR